MITNQEEGMTVDTEQTDTGTAYHATVEDFRRSLVAGHLTWVEVADTYNGAITRDADGNKGPEAERDAWGAAVMASSYSYVLAAIIKLAEQEFGPEVAQALASEADDLLTNGDDEPGWNADVMPSNGGPTVAGHAAPEHGRDQ